MSQRPSRHAWKLPTASQPASVLANLNKRGGKSSPNAETDTGIHYILPFELIARGQGFACTTQRCLLPLSRLHCCVGRQTSMPSNPRSPPLRAATQTSGQGKQRRRIAAAVSPVQQPIVLSLAREARGGGRGRQKCQSRQERWGVSEIRGKEGKGPAPLGRVLSINCPLSVRRQVSGLLLVCTKLDFGASFLPRSLPC